MSGRVWTWVMGGSLALALVKPAAAQMSGPVTAPAGIRHFSAYTGILSPFGYRAPQVPTVWLVPNHVVHYQATEPVYVWLKPNLPAVTPVQIRTLTLGGPAALADARVASGSAVTWVNEGHSGQTLLVRRRRAGSETVIGSGRWQIGPNESLSLQFNQPGIYEYSTQAEPAQHAQIVVAE